MERLSLQVGASGLFTELLNVSSKLFSLFLKQLLFFLKARGPTEEVTFRQHNNFHLSGPRNDTFAQRETGAGRVG